MRINSTTGDLCRSNLPPMPSQINKRVIRRVTVRGLQPVPKASVRWGISEEDLANRHCSMPATGKRREGQDQLRILFWVRTRDVVPKLSIKKSIPLSSAVAATHPWWVRQP